MTTETKLRDLALKAEMLANGIDTAADKDPAVAKPGVRDDMLLQLTAAAEDIAHGLRMLAWASRPVEIVRPAKTGE